MELQPRLNDYIERLKVVEASIQLTHLNLTAEEFFGKVSGFKPTRYQAELARLFQENQFTAARWCRQSGKSHFIASLLLYYALTHPGSWIGVVAPGLRQAKYVIRKIELFLKKMPASKYLCPRPMRTALHFTNGSSIEAFPNNPETIRGPALNVVYWDEACLTPNDEELFDAVLFTLGATGGKFICSSTPWRKDSVFYKIFHHRAFGDFAVSHVTWEQAVEPYGPLKSSILEKIRNQYAEDPWRWRREMEAEWAEDETTWLSQDLITRCIATERTLGYELELWDPDDVHKGAELYAGLDLGKHRDYSVLVVIEKVKGVFLLRYVKIFPLETPYATVIGWVKTLQDRWGGFRCIRVDMTGVGDYIVEDMTNAGIENVEGVLFTQFRKREMASLLKERMKSKQFYFPYFEFNLPYYRSSYVAELHVERFELTKDGSIKFSHPAGSKDDVFWATALAIVATMELGPEPFLAVAPR
ncbi:MAG: Terminase-like family protein [Candidatus Bathyarchaeota archaeon BA1]|nr:MAG: Terminase-like family protein [Candidatus Bathyarchaeota archaeon BA1]